MKTKKHFWNRFLAFAMAFVMSASLCITGIAYADNEYTVDYDVTYNQTEARKAIDTVNEFRQSDDAWYTDTDGNRRQVTGLSKLTYDYDLEEIAMQRVAELVVSFDYNRPNGDSFDTAFSEKGYGTNGCAESIYSASVYYGQYASDVVEAFIDERESSNVDDQADCRAMLNSDYTNFASACVYMNNIYYWVFLYALPTSSHNTTSTTANNGVTTVTTSVRESLIMLESTTYDDVVLRVNESLALPKLSAYITASQYSGVNIPVSVSDYSWVSSDTSVVTVENGSVIGFGGGTATISTTINGMTASFEVSVVENIIHISAKESTCIEHGNIEYWYVEDTDQYFADEELTKEITYEDTILPLGEHHYVETIDIEPTCTTEGLATFTCSVCGASYEEILPMTDHQWSATFNWDEDSSPITCTVTFVCDECGKVEGPFECALSEVGDPTIKIEVTATYIFDGKTYTDTITVRYGDDIIDFMWNDDYTECYLYINDGSVSIVKCDVGWIETIEPTCSSEGLMEYIAWYGSYVSDPVWTEEIPKLAHQWNVQFHWDVENETCTISFVCSVCGEVDGPYECDVSWEIVAEPTCETDGLKILIAQYDEYVSDSGETEIIPALGHEWVIDFLWNDTHTECIANLKCERCGETYTAECEITETDDSYIATISYDGETFADTVEKDKTNEQSTDSLKEELQKLFDSYILLNNENYTEESWNVLQEALANAEAVLANENATESEIASAIEALESAYIGLTSIDSNDDGNDSDDDNGDNKPNDDGDNNDDDNNSGNLTDTTSSDNNDSGTTSDDSNSNNNVNVSSGNVSSSSDNGTGSSTNGNTTANTTDTVKTGNNMLPIMIGFACFAICGLAITTFVRKAKVVKK